MYPSRHIKRFSPSTDAKTLYQFKQAVSPHVAALGAGLTDGEVLRRISDHLHQCAATASASASPSSVAYLETAGGVHSPSPSGSSTAHLLRPLRLPTILIGDSLLGGISTTRAAYDALVLAGHDVQALLLFADAGRGLGNAEYLTKWGRDIGLPVWALSGPSGGDLWGLPPAKHASTAEDEQNMLAYYRGLVQGRGSERASADESPNGLVDAVRYLRKAHEDRLADLDSMASRTRESCWWPFTQHTLARTDGDVNVIDSAHGDFFSVYRSQKQKKREEGDYRAEGSRLSAMLDGSASWWTQCLGHADAGLTMAAARAAGRYGHVLFPMSTNEPALRLTEGLLGVETNQKKRKAMASPGKGWASRVFFSDDGSTGMEVALKMAIASSVQRYDPRSLTSQTAERVEPGRSAGHAGGRSREQEWTVLGLRGSYHGDTIGAMDACEGGIFNSAVEWYRGRGSWIEPPTVSIRDGEATVTVPQREEGQPWDEPGQTLTFDDISDVFDVDARLSSELCATYRRQLRKWIEDLVVVQGKKFGALVLEPLVLGAGGMIFVDPLFQRCLVDVVRDSEDLFALTDPPLRSARTPQPPRGEDDWRGLPVIFDEVFTGLYRLGFTTPASILGIRPDVSVLAKILTGGMVPMSVTLARSSIFDTFSQSDKKVDALLHGHSYTAHPIGCEVANDTLGRIERMRTGGEWSKEWQDWGAVSSSGSRTGEDEEVNRPWSFWSKEATLAFSRHSKVESCMALGTVLVLYLREGDGQGGAYSVVLPFHSVTPLLTG